MNSSPININQITYKGQPTHTFKFQKGMVFLGKIKELFPNNIATLQIGTKTYHAKLDVALSLGNTYWFLIEQISSSGVPYITTLNNKQVKDPFQQLLDKLNLSKDSETTILLKQLFNEQGSIDYHKIPSIVKWVKGTPLLNKDTAVQTILFMLKNNFPLEKPIFDSLMKFYTTESLTEKLTTLYEQINKLQPKTEQMTRYMDWLQSLKQQRTFLPNKILSLLGISYEFGLMQEKLQNNNQLSIVQLKPILLSLITEHQNSAVQKSAEEILHWLSGQQLVNVDTNDKIVNYLFQLPYYSDEEKQDLWLKIQGYKEENGQINEENHKLSFYMRLTNLKETVVELTTQKKIASVKIYNGSDITLLTDTLTPFFAEKLMDIGYQLSSIKSYQKENIETYFFTPKATEQVKVDKRI